MPIGKGNAPIVSLGHSAWRTRSVGGIDPLDTISTWLAGGRRPQTRMRLIDERWQELANHDEIAMPPKNTALRDRNRRTSGLQIATSSTWPWDEGARSTRADP
jgi:hypothetical protein